ncbi:TniQ family protein [Mesorhizobium sp. M1233]|uniref:TniQ family protein n=1 Tax=Mesorhizobium sp. M1233 TaxID=2957072 RepID=UPI00333D5976
MENTRERQLPVRLPPYLDELLSSWIGRHASFYAVPPLVMLRHCLPEASSLRAADLHLSSDQEIRLANMLATDPAVVHRMTFANVAQPLRRLIATRPTHYCTNCSSAGAEPAPILRNQLLGWRITCPVCGNQLRDAGEREFPSPFQQYRFAALRGQNLLDDETERGIRTWTSATEIARLLLMRRIPIPIPHEHDLWRFRVLGAIIPESLFSNPVNRENLASKILTIKCQS